MSHRPPPEPEDEESPYRAPRAGRSRPARVARDLGERLVVLVRARADLAVEERAA